MKIKLTILISLISTFALADCDGDSANFIHNANCGFDLNTSGWIVSASGIFDADDFLNQASSGSLLATSIGSSTSISQCVNYGAPSSADKTIGAWFKLVTGADVSCRINYTQYGATDCNTSSGFSAAATSLSVINTLTWVEVREDVVSALNIQSMLFNMVCLGQGADFTVKSDNAYLVPQGALPVELMEFSID